MAKFNPEDGNADLLPKGEYEVEVKNAYDGESKSSGKPCVKLHYIVYLPDGKTKQLFDTVPLHTKGGVTRLKKLCAALNLNSAFKTGELDPSVMIGGMFTGYINVQTDESGQWPDKNVVAGYRQLQRGLGAANSGHVEPAKDKPAESMKDDIPF